MAKKTFVNHTGLQDDPALSFISLESVQPVQAYVANPPTVAVPQNPRSASPHIEVKSRRVQLVMQPSLYLKVKEASVHAGLSFNEYCHQALERVVGGHQDVDWRLAEGDQRKKPL